MRGFFFSIVRPEKRGRGGGRIFELRFLFFSYGNFRKDFYLRKKEYSSVLPRQIFPRFTFADNRKERFGDKGGGFVPK